jgi:hypothetical protein
MPLGNLPAEHDGCGAGGLHPGFGAKGREQTEGRSATSGGLQMLSNMESHPEEWEDKSIGKI